MTQRTRVSILMAAAFLGAFAQVGCQTPKQGRDWRLHDTRSEYRSTRINFETAVREDDTGRRLGEFNLVERCIEILPRIDVVDTFECWRVYEATDWKEIALGVRTSQTFLITDPPGQPYAGVSPDRASPADIPSGVRKPVGSITSELSLATYPMRLEIQVGVGSDHAWVSDPEDSRIIIKSVKEVRDEAANQQLKFSLCLPDLQKLKAVPASEFTVRFRVSSLDWPAGGKSVEPRTFSVRERITRDLIDSILDATRQQQQAGTNRP